MTLTRFLCASLLALTLLPSPSQAEVYLRPRVGAALNLQGGENSFSLGGTVGYHVIPLIAVETTYTRLFAINSGPDGHSLRGNLIVRAPMGVFTPFASVGGGWLNFENGLGGSVSKGMGLIGGGISIAKFSFLSACIGAEYAIVNQSQDFLEPYASVGVSF